jgi:hypothetical protein
MSAKVVMRLRIFPIIVIGKRQGEAQLLAPSPRTESRYRFPVVQTEFLWRETPTFRSRRNKTIGLSSRKVISYRWKYICLGKETKEIVKVGNIIHAGLKVVLVCTNTRSSLLAGLRIDEKHLPDAFRVRRYGWFGSNVF